MIEKEQSNCVLLIGPDYRGRGGIASVLAQYKEMFECFHFVATSRQAGKIKNLLIALGAFVICAFRMADPKIAIVHIHTASHLDFFRHAFLLFSPSVSTRRFCSTCTAEILNVFTTVTRN